MSKRKVTLDKSELETLYWAESLSLGEMANIFGCTKHAVHYMMIKLGVPRRSMKEAKLGNCPWNKGRPWTDNIKAKISLSKIGISHAPHSPRTKAKMSKKRKERWANDPNYAMRVINAKNRRPNKSEQKLIDLFKDKGLPFKYVGDGEVILGRHNPDFINCNGKKEIIELFGERWHNASEEQQLKDLYAQYGYKTIVIWYKELFGSDWQSKILDKVEIG